MSFIYDETEVQSYPTIALRGIVVFPGITTSFELGRKLSVSSLKFAAEQKSPVYLAIQKNPAIDDPDPYDLTEVGVVARIANVLRLTNGNYQIMAEGLFRARRISTVREDDRLESEVLPYNAKHYSSDRMRKAVDSLWGVFNDYLRYVNKPPSEILDELHRVDDPGLLADFFAVAVLAFFIFFEVEY